MYKKIPFLGILAAIATIIFSIESLVPLPVPWVRIGLANLVTVLILIWWGTKDAFFVLFLRILLGSLLIGKFLQPAFFLSLSGGCGSLLVMALILRFYPRWIGLVGLSVMGAVTHNLVQILFSFLLYIHHVKIFTFLPFFLFTGLLTGCLIGFLAHLIDFRLGHKITARENPTALKEITT